MWWEGCLEIFQERTIKAGSKDTFLWPESVLLPKCDILKRQHSVYKTSVESQCLCSLLLMNRGWQQHWWSLLGGWFASVIAFFKRTWCIFVCVASKWCWKSQIQHEVQYVQRGSTESHRSLRRIYSLCLKGTGNKKGIEVGKDRKHNRIILEQQDGDCAVEKSPPEQLLYS